MQKLSCENDLHESEPVGEVHFHIEWCCVNLCFDTRHKATWEWPIQAYFQSFDCV